MYRQHLKAMENEQLVSRVTGLPVVSSAWEQVSALYSKTKDYNSLTRLTCQLAESGANLAVIGSKPVVGLFEPQLSYVNDYGLKKLEAITDAYPIITKPTEEVVEETKAYVEKAVRPTYDLVVAPVNFTVDKVNSVKNYGIEKVTAVKSGVTSRVEEVKSGAKRTVNFMKDFGCNTVQEVLETSYGKALKTRVENSICTAETLVDTYLPEEEKDETKAASVEKAVSADTNMVVRVGTLGNKVRRRMYDRAMREVTRLQLRSKEALDNLNYSVDLMKYAHEHFDSAKNKMSDNYEAARDKMADIWDQVKRDEDEKEEETEKDFKELTLERRTILAARFLTSRLKQSMSMLSAMPDRVLPTTMKVKVQEMKQYTEEWLKAFTEAHSVLDIPAIALDQVKTQIARVQEMMLDMTDYILATPALSWLGLRKAKSSDIETEPLSCEMETMQKGDETMDLGGDDELDEYEDEEFHEDAYNGDSDDVM